MTPAPVHVLVCHQRELPETFAFLSEAEAEQLASLGSAPRRASWILGRFAVKRALSALLARAGQAARYADLEVRPLPSGAPRAFVRGLPAPFSVSLSHRDDVAFVALGPPSLAIGCDVERVEPRSRAFVADFFTAGEAALVEASPDRDALACFCWSAKESALKVTAEGLRADTRSVEIALAAPSTAAWAPFGARLETGAILHGHHRRDGDLVFTVAADAPLATPALLAP